jgi:hypothetical protein
MALAADGEWRAASEVPIVDPYLGALEDGMTRFADLERAEARILSEKLTVVRSALDHTGEKGASLEGFVRRLLRTWLPQEYGITSGFILFPPEKPNDEPTLSPQLDIIIYDALRAAPLVRLPSCDVVPLEAVFAYVEVKASLAERTPSILRKCLTDAATIRANRTRWFWVSTGAVKETPKPFRFPSIRSFLFAFEGPKKAETLASSLEQTATSVGGHAHFSGAFVGGCGFFHHVRLDPKDAGTNDPYKVEYEHNEEMALSAFKRELIRGLARFDRFSEKRKHISAPEGHATKTITVSPTAPFLDHYYRVAQPSGDSVPGEGNSIYVSTTNGASGQAVAAMTTGVTRDSEAGLNLDADEWRRSTGRDVDGARQHFVDEADSGNTDSSGD